MIDRTEFAWAAGFYDGEGCTLISKGNKIEHNSIRATVSQSRKDMPSLMRFAGIVSPNGVLYGPYQRGENRSPHITWCAHGRQALETLTLLWPYLSEPKKEQAERVFNQWWLSHTPKIRAKKAKLPRVYAHPTDKLAQRRLYYRTHQEQIKKQAHEWYLANKDTPEYREKRRKYMAEFRRRKKLGL